MSEPETSPHFPILSERRYWILVAIRPGEKRHAEATAGFAVRRWGLGEYEEKAQAEHMRDYMNAHLPAGVCGFLVVRCAVIEQLDDDPLTFNRLAGTGG